MTHEEIDKIVEEWVTQIADEIKEGSVSREEPHDAVFEAVDEGWTELGFEAGLISEWPVNPGAEILGRCGEVLDYCEQEAWIEDDSGLWDGLHGAAILGIQAFFSLQNVLWEKLRERNVID